MQGGSTVFFPPRGCDGSQSAGYAPAETAAYSKLT